MRKIRQLQQRFDEKYMPAPNTGCWLWLGYLTCGYGRFKVHEPGGMVARPAHRISYQLHVGPIPAGMDILHACNEPSCVNPAHLRPGTDIENTADKMKAGRQARIIGTAHSRSKLTDSLVMTLRARHGAGETGSALAREVGVSSSVMSRVLRGLNWRHVPLFLKVAP